MVQEEIRFNPFPGLRPFEEDEDYLFFGREKQIDELLTKLRTTRFLAVVGTSGSGKSSLVKCGLLPGLYGGFMAGASSSWRICTFRPGTDPIFNLAEALALPGVLYDHLDPDEPHEIQMHSSLLGATLTRSKSGLRDAVFEARIPGDENLLIVVDQFEELFRYNKEEVSQSPEERKSVAFVKLLLDAAEQRDQNIFIVITMRSDFLGDCTQFRGLPEAINQGQYLIPRMTREEMKDAITGPIAVGGSDISPILLTRLLNDVGDKMDQLPVLQHALMRTWDRWEKEHEEGERLDLRHYEAVGGMSEALSQHADELFESLADRELQDHCELLFKAITEKSEGGRGIRRPTSVKELMEITGVPLAAVVKIVDTYRADGARFLMPPPTESLQEDTLLDISHESLMRVWRRLIQWVDEEMVSAERFKDLAERAEKWHGYGQVGYLQDPELQLMINWRNKQKPTEAWARRFRSLQYETAMVYLRVSEERRTQLEERERRERRRRFLLISGFALVLFVASIVSILLFLNARSAWKQAEASQIEAEIQRVEAENQAVIAKEKQAEAEVLQRMAIQSADEAFEQRQLAEAREQEAIAARFEAIGQREAAILARQKADSLRIEADTSANRAARSAKVAQVERDRAETALEETDRLKKLAEARSLGVDALQLLLEGQLELGTSLALQAYDTNRVYRGPMQNDDIYPALSKAWQAASEPNSYQTPLSNYDIRSLAFNTKQKVLATGDDGGEVMLYRMNGKFEVVGRVQLASPIRAIEWTSAGSLVVGMRNGRWIQIARESLQGTINLSEGTATSKIQSPVLDLKVVPHPEGERVVWATKDALFMASLNGEEVLTKWEPAEGRITSLLVDGETAYVGKGKRLYQLPLGEVVRGKPWIATEVLDFGVSEEGNFSLSALGQSDTHFAIGASSGTVWVLPKSDMATNLSKTALSASRYRFHQASITHVDFYPTGDKLLTTSLDRTARLWIEDVWKGHTTNDVLVLSDHERWVWDGTFLGTSDFFVTASQDRRVRCWYWSTNSLANALK